MEQRFHIPEAAAELAWAGLAVSTESQVCGPNTGIAAVGPGPGAGPNTGIAAVGPGPQGAPTAMTAFEGKRAPGASFSELLELRKG